MVRRLAWVYLLGMAGLWNGGRTYAQQKSGYDTGVVQYQVVTDTALDSVYIRKTFQGRPLWEGHAMSIDSYVTSAGKAWMQRYLHRLSMQDNYVREGNFLTDLDFGELSVGDLLRRGLVEIKPQGSIELKFSVDVRRTKNPFWSIQQQRPPPQFKLDPNIQFSVNGKIANKLRLGINFDTESLFRFDDQVKIAWEGKEDDIIKSFEAGNINLTLPTTLITGAQNLFGFKSTMQFGKLYVSTVFSQQQSERKEITLEGTSRKEEFRIPITDYDDNRHFFLAQYMHAHYDQWNATLPVVSSPIYITRIEVWVTNTRQTTQDVRNVMAFMDLGEPQPYNSTRGGGSLVLPKGGALFPDNQSNTLYDFLSGNPQLRNANSVTQALSAYAAPPYNFQNGQDYLKIENARKLKPNEYTLNPYLGYISLSQSLNPNEALAVAFEYTINGQRFQVGEFSTDVPPNPDTPSVLFLKLVKNINVRPDLPTWDLMMKNIYPLGAFQIQRKDFDLQVVYQDDKTGTDLVYIPEPDEPNLYKKLLIQVLRLDQLNEQNEPAPDGQFDFLDRITILPDKGLVIFPVVEPFGDFLARKFTDSLRAERYVFRTLYDSTKFYAEQQAAKNKFFLKGSYASSSGKEIALNAINIPRGSVKVTANGVPLTENVDYTVDYLLGTVRILNESILQSGAVIKVSLESQTVLAFQQKTLLGTRLEYRYSPKVRFGGTFLHLWEKPLVQKINIGYEPIANSIWGVDGSFDTRSLLLTHLLNKLPLIRTKEPSRIVMEGEFAHLIPGHPKVLGKTGTAYIDDFEGSEVPYDLKLEGDWKLASRPRFQDYLFRRYNPADPLSEGYDRALISWYSIDDIFYRNAPTTPTHIRADKDMRSNHYMRQVQETEVFPNKQLPNGLPAILRTFDVAFYPHDRGPYNYSTFDLAPDGRLTDPQSRWGGIMRRLEVTDFEAANIEMVEFWLMDPFIYNPDNGGELYLQLGYISEDIVPDGYRFFENGMPTDTSTSGLARTPWGYAPTHTPVNYAFNNDPQARPHQDVGLEGLTTERERTFHQPFLDSLKSVFGTASAVYQQAFEDPSADNYRYYLGDEWDQQQADILLRYKYYSLPEGNSPTPDQWPSGYSNARTPNPDVEDINRDFTLNDLEAYFQYRISLRPEDLEVGKNHITDVRVANVRLPNGKVEQVKWYQFKIPVRDYDQSFGAISDFRSVQFMRMMLRGFSDSVVLRFGELQLVRNEWRRYLESLGEEREEVANDNLDQTTFQVSSVNIEENGRRTPIPYVLPPGIEREVTYYVNQQLEENEQSMALRVCGLNDGDARAVYKTVGLDVRQYKYLKMFVHAEGDDLSDGDLWIFVRLGTDFKENYYEYAIPLKVTPPGARTPYEIWPSENEIRLRFNELYRAKQVKQNLGLPFGVAYTVPSDSGGYVTVKGRPDLSNVRVMMIGIRNPLRTANPLPDDGLSKCGEIWVNELRLTDFEEKGGWAARGRATVKLADLGRVNLTAQRKTIGFGSIEQKLQERNLVDQQDYSMGLNLSLGKLFPTRWNVSLPLYYSMNEQINRPKYNPLDPDLLLAAALEAYPTRRARDSVRRIVEDYTMRRSFNFTNIRVGRSGNAPRWMFFHPALFNFTYAYQETYKRNIRQQYNLQRTQRLLADYTYTFPNSGWRPFKFLKGRAFRLLNSMTINFLPRNLTINSELQRYYSSIKFRTLVPNAPELDPIFNKNFTFKRTYDLSYPVFPSLMLTYHAVADARVREPEGPLTSEVKDSIWTELKKLGTLRKFDQQITANYNLPFNRIQLLNWINASTSYSASLQWDEAPPTTPTFGNTIQNSARKQLNTQLNMVNFYNKIKFLKNINAGRSNVEHIRKRRYEKLRKQYLADKQAGEKVNPPPSIDEIEVPERTIKMFESLLRFLMVTRNISLTYSLNEGTFLPGFLPSPRWLGLSADGTAPGWPFILGIQDPNFHRYAAQQGWLTTDTSLNTLYRLTRTENFTGRIQLEPIKALRINVTFNRQHNHTDQRLFRATSQGAFQEFNPLKGGSFSTSFMSLRTAFRAGKEEGRDEIYQQFENNRYVIAQRLAPWNTIDTITHYPLGYGPRSQQVITPALIAAIAGKNSNSAPLDPFSLIPAPNWRITYSGLGQLPLFKPYVNSITINHNYTSTFNISRYSNYLQYDPNEPPQYGKNLTPELQFHQIAISENLNPLLGINVLWKNGMTTSFNFQQQRTIMFSFASYQYTETFAKTINFGLTYRTREFVLPFRIRGKQKVLENDLTFRLDMSLEDRQTVLRRLDEDRKTSTSGNRRFLLKPSIEYAISRSLTARIFFTRTSNVPYVENTYPTSLSSGGFSIRWSLGM